MHQTRKGIDFSQARTQATGCTALDFDLNYLLTMEMYKQLHISRH
jgi:hypothetical protein